MSLMFVALLALSGVDSLSTVAVGKLKLKAPREWRRSQPDDSSWTWEEPQSGASFELSVFPVDPQRPARLCVKQMVDALGKAGFEAIPLGAHPAARKVTSDVVRASDAPPSSEGEKVTTTTVVGCNGRTKWLLTWASKTNDGARFGPMLKRVLESIGYTR